MEVGGGPWSGSSSARPTTSCSRPPGGCARCRSMSSAAPTATAARAGSPQRSPAVSTMTARSSTRGGHRRLGRNRQGVLRAARRPGLRSRCWWLGTATGSRRCKQELEQRYGVGGRGLSRRPHDRHRREPAGGTLDASLRNLALLVNNAGFGTRGALADASPGRQEAMLQLHVMAPMRLSQAALPVLLKQPDGAPSSTCPRWPRLSSPPTT